jgi:hypothetical protein
MFLQLHHVLNSVRVSFQRSWPESWAESWLFGYWSCEAAHEAVPNGPQVWKFGEILLVWSRGHLLIIASMHVCRSCWSKSCSPIMIFCSLICGAPHLHTKSHVHLTTYDFLPGFNALGGKFCLLHTHEMPHEFIRTKGASIYSENRKLQISCCIHVFLDP